MTKINRVTIHGFKSFAHKTDIPFDSKYNCILSPNGSVRSNVGDALCFVLGRLSAKSMRAEKASNLIFNGGKKKKPSSQGTVEIEFCNKNKTFPLEDKSVVVSRTITKKGSSIYKINGKKHTRTQVLDTLGHSKINPDGYNIILQGDITRFVTMSPVERRKIIEQISDVSVYEEKKHKAMLELNKVEEKLNSAQIILKERGTYLKELKKDRDQALEFKNVKDNIDSHKATYLHLQITEKEAEKAKLDEQIGKHEAKIGTSQTKIDELKAKVNSSKNEIQSINKEIEQKGEKEQVKVHKEIEDLKVGIAKNRTRVSSLKDEINKIQQRKDQFAIEMRELNEKTSSFSQNQKALQKAITTKQRELKELESKIAQFKKKNKIESSQELDKEIEDKDKLIEQKQEEVQKIRQQQQELLREKDKIEYQLQTIDERISKVNAVKKENQAQLRQLQQHKTNFKQATLKLNKCLDADSSFASQIANARANLTTLQEKHATLNAKSLSAQATLQANQAVNAIISNKKKFSGVHGTIVDLGQVKRKHAQALESAAGGRMQHIVVDSDKTAAECIKYLKNNKLGSASFIPLNKIRYQEITTDHKKHLKKSGVHDFALNLVSYNSKYKKAFQYVFGPTLVVDDIDTARNVGIGTMKMATLDGNIAEASGAMRGGFMNKRRGAGFKEKDSLEELSKVEAELAQVQSIISNIQDKRAANEQEISSLRNLRGELEGEIIKLEKTLHLDTGDLNATADLKKELSAQLKSINAELANIQKQVTLTNRDLAALKSKKQILRSQVSQLRNPRLLAQLSAFEESKQKCREDLLRHESDLKNSTNNMEQLIGPEQIKMQEILKQHEKEEVQFTNEVSTLTKSLTAQEKELVQREKASKEFYSKYHGLFNQRDKLNNTINKWENEVEMLREKSRGSEREVNLVSLKNAEIKAKLAGLNEEFSRFKEVKLLKNKTTQELHKEISKFEVILGQMSAVNMKALEVYEQVHEEFQKLIDKKQSLASEKTDVLTMMNEIETKKKDHFMKTFNQTNDSFKNVFTELFKKGKAHLELDNPKKPFEDGLSIKVKISGNRYMDLKSLSGGEKTLTALSFIFAVQEYQPATFYILDEIDAALDKHNSEKLSKLIRNYSDNAQYIVISHNDSIISEADTLFGVSMQEGVSKITSLKI